MNKLNINKAKKIILILSRIGLSTLPLPLISSSCNLEKSQPSENPGAGTEPETPAPQPETPTPQPDTPETGT